MTKGARLVVRMSPELRAWVHEQAAGREQDDAAFVRMMLSELRRIGAPPMLVTPSVLAPPPNYAALELEVDQPAPAQPSPEIEPPVDIDTAAMIAQSLDQAERQGLTEPAPQPEHVSLGGVRAVSRPPMRYSPKAQSSWLQQA